MIQDACERIRWNMLSDRVPRDEVNRLFFGSYSYDREETSIKDL